MQAQPDCYIMTMNMNTLPRRALLPGGKRRDGAADINGMKREERKMKRRMLTLLMALVLLCTLLPATAQAEGEPEYDKIPVTVIWEHGTNPKDAWPSVVGVTLESEALSDGFSFSYNNGIFLYNNWKDSFNVARTMPDGSQLSYTVSDGTAPGYKTTYTDPVFSTVSVEKWDAKTVIKDGAASTAGDNLLIAKRGEAYDIWTQTALDKWQRTMLIGIINGAGLEGIGATLTESNVSFFDTLPGTIAGATGTEDKIAITAEAPNAEKANRFAFKGSTWSLAYTAKAVITPNQAAIVRNTFMEGGSLKITKTFAEGSALGAANVGGSISFAVTGPDNYSSTVSLDASVGWTKTLDALAPGQYTVAENAASAGRTGYDATSPASTVSATVEKGKTAEAAISNSYAQKTTDVNVPGYLNIQMVDAATGAALVGGSFQLFDAAGKTVGSPVAADASGKAQLGPFTAAATYTLKELTAPLNYDRISTAWTVTVSLKDGDPTVSAAPNSDGVFEYAYNWLVGVTPADGYADGVLTIGSTRSLGSLTVTKAVKKTVEGDENAVFPDDTGLISDSYSFAVTIGGERQEFSLKDGESKTFDKIPYGTTYRVEELVPDDAAYNRKALINGVGVISLPNTPVKVTNEYVYDPAGSSVTFFSDKLDSTTGELIPSAGFTLYSDAACTKKIAGYSSNSNGYMDIDFSQPGVYYLKETTAPDGYKLNPKVITITVTADGYKVAGRRSNIDNVLSKPIIVKNLVLTADLESYQSGDIVAYKIMDDPIKPIEITAVKVWGSDDEKTRPSSVTVVLYKDGTKYDTQTLSAANNWTYTWKGEEITDEFTWKVNEPVVPKGYFRKVTQTNYTFTILNSGRPITDDGALPLLWTLLAVTATAGLLFTAKRLRKKHE